MKKLLCTLAFLACTTAAAQGSRTTQEDIYVASNDGGGQIVLTTRSCFVDGQFIDELYEAYTWSPTTPMQPGCWALIDGFVQVIYLDKKRDIRVYPADLFTKRSVPK